jgi:hypothetical protein
MTTDRPGGGAESSAEQIPEGPGFAVAERRPSSAEARVAEEHRIRGAGVPPPGPASASGMVPSTPIPGAGRPPTGPAPADATAPRAPAPGTESGLTEWERSRRGLTDQAADGDPRKPGRRWFRPAAAAGGATTGGAAPEDQTGAASRDNHAEVATSTAVAIKTEQAPAPKGTARKPLPSTRPPGAPPDPWTAFATIPDREPGRFRRGARAAGRAFLHEYALVIYAGLALAVVLTWPALRYPLHTLPQDVYDPARQAWQVAWIGHVLQSEPVRLWQANAFFPERYNFAFGSSLLGYAPAGVLGEGVNAAILRYNILFVLAHALLFVGAYALIRQLGAGRTGAVVGAVAFAYAPWRLAQEGHLDIVSAGGIPLALAMLARGHGWSMRPGFRPGHRRVGWAVAGWMVAIWQVSLGFTLGLPFAYVIGGILLVMAVAVPVRRWRTAPRRRPKAVAPITEDSGTGADQPARMPTTGAENGKQAGISSTEVTTSPAPKPKLTVPAARPPGSPPRLRGRPSVLGWRLLLTDTLGMLILVGLGALIAAPYFRVPATGPSTAEIDFFSPPLRSFLIAPAESRIWGVAHSVPRSSLGWPAEMSLLPGFVLYALALAGLFFSIWTVWQRLLLVAGLAVAVIFTLGTGFFEGRWTYLPLFGHLPGSLGVRIPGRLMLWVTLLLAVLAAGAVAELVRRAEQLTAHRMPPWPGPWLRLATFVPLILVLAETINATPHPVVPAQPAAMRTEAGPMLVLPTAPLGDQTVMLWSTSRFQPIANGGGGFAAAQQAELRQAVAGFPDAASVQYLRETGVTTVLLIRNQVGGTPWERAGDVPVDALGIRREDLDDNTVIFRLS